MNHTQLLEISHHELSKHLYPIHFRGRLLLFPHRTLFYHTPQCLPVYGCCQLWAIHNVNITMCSSLPYHVDNQHISLFYIINLCVHHWLMGFLYGGITCVFQLKTKHKPLLYCPSVMQLCISTHSHGKCSGQFECVILNIFQWSILRSFLSKCAHVYAQQCPGNPLPINQHQFRSMFDFFYCPMNIGTNNTHNNNVAFNNGMINIM